MTWETGMLTLKEPLLDDSTYKFTLINNQSRYRFTQVVDQSSCKFDVFKDDLHIGSFAYVLSEECYVFTFLSNDLKTLLSPSLLKSKQQIILNF